MTEDQITAKLMSDALIAGRHVAEEYAGQSVSDMINHVYGGLEIDDKNASPEKIYAMAIETVAIMSLVARQMLGNPDDGAVVTQ